MKRGEIWTVSGGIDYAGKPRPAVIVQDDIFPGTRSIIVCLITSDLTETPIFRVPVEPSEINGLRTPSRLMVDKIGTIPKSKVGNRIGRLSNADIVRLNRTMMVFLGLASTRGS
ncbi:MAG: type II toxin-antitoxin system PemK/MazF family toxin [Proteobacteria bacterium]|nr:type II toxin-antitoxin system PemK/MazF family toxin [Pseudomonadota bacterium]